MLFQDYIFCMTKFKILGFSFRMKHPLAKVLNILVIAFFASLVFDTNTVYLTFIENIYQ